MQTELTPRRCPGCHGWMNARRVGEVEVDRCHNCGGVWFDRDELDRLLPSAARELRATGDRIRISARPCPNDGTDLLTVTYPQTHVEVDLCPDCDGLWLDAGELKEIQKVRDYHARQDTLEQYAPVPGIKGGLLRLIETMLTALTQPLE